MAILNVELQEEMVGRFEDDGSIKSWPKMWANGLPYNRISDGLPAAKVRVSFNGAGFICQPGGITRLVIENQTVGRTTVRRQKVTPERETESESED